MRTKLFILILLSFFTANVCLAEEEVIDNVFEVKGLSSFSDSDTLDNAQREATNQTIQEAFSKLLERILPKSMHWKIDTIKKEQAFDLVKATKIVEERKTSHSYMATIDVEFNSDAIRNLLNVLGINYADQYATQMLVVPYISIGKDKTIWGNGKWSEEWGMAPSVYGLQKLSYMLGDIEDITFFDDKNVANFDFNNYKKILKKYEASSVLLIEAKKDQGVINTVVRILSDTDDLTLKTNFKFDSKQSESEVYSSYIDDILNKVDEYYKGVDLFDKKKTYRTRLNVKINDLKDWQGISAKLKEIPEIEELSVINNSTNLIIVDMLYNSEPVEMSDILAKKKFEISEEGDIQYLRLIRN